jgi:xanthine/uracil permease
MDIPVIVIGTFITLIGCMLMTIGFISVSRGCGAQNAWLIFPGVFIGVSGVVLVFLGMH